jgi:hypothetical protein
VAEQTQRAVKAEAEHSASDSAAESAAGEHKREMAALKSDLEALRAEVARSEATDAINVTAVMLSFVNRISKFLYPRSHQKFKDA